MAANETRLIKGRVTEEHGDKFQSICDSLRMRTTRALEECIDIAFKALEAKGDIEPPTNGKERDNG